MGKISILPQTHSLHCIEVWQPYMIVCKRFLTDTKQTLFDFQQGTVELPVTKTGSVCNLSDNVDAVIEVSALQFSVGQYVLAKFATKQKLVNYIGVIETSDKEEVEVSFLRKQSSGVFVKPPKIDRSWLHVTDIVRVLSPPVIDNRGHYKFDEVLEAC